MMGSRYLIILSIRRLDFLNQLYKKVLSLNPISYFDRMNIKTNNTSSNSAISLALFSLSFRPFFLSAGIFAVMSISFWTLIYLFNYELPLTGMSTTQWHAHEMVYGYGMAVLAGFLLTAAKNWTGIQTIHGKLLMLLFTCWVIARGLLFFGSANLPLAAIFDLLFGLGVTISLAHPIVKVKQWKQLALVIKIALLLVFNGLFYLGALGMLEQGINWGIYGGLMLIISLVMTLGRRVIPFFIERGVEENVTLSNHVLLDRSNLFLFLSFSIVEVFFKLPLTSAILALALLLVNATRLIGWYTPGIWRKSLLWSLYLAYWFICLGFALYAARYFFALNPYLAIHALAYGGIGMMTLGMMSRVSLGHTGRGIQNPSPLLRYIFAGLLIGGLFRVIVPLFETQHYLWWVGLSQVLWIASFLAFVVLYFPMLIKPRLDGRPG